MKISELISILERAQKNFDDCDVEIMESYNSGYPPNAKIVAKVSIEVGGPVTLFSAAKPSPQEAT